METSISQIWMVCHLFPFAKVGQYNIVHPFDVWHTTSDKTALIT